MLKKRNNYGKRQVENGIGINRIVLIYCSCILMHACINIQDL